MDKKSARLRRGRRTRGKLKEGSVYRLCVHRTPRNIYAQVISPKGDRVLAATSTLNRDVRRQIENGGNIFAATVVGRKISEMIAMLGIKQVSFDRSGFKYHGRVKALAEAIRAEGIKV
uniref:Large ribosomal subunit protein uL18 n=1 Tax=Candidatus Kentrum sp. MB TaxID=2138164 RepID=A0A450XHE3_9GAMM|nr:MAG: LSU ribosomal protein L18P [Candidatus Kentron sp. MB]VFK32238.1 MAG: LSU ribosomal protein L18P [Candidatus Kentron sp. MB]VFK75767.1 MAG: LSU ribosomal protein L18P [Candidatus Kentron sp. MB]